tara:strand:+ start:197 stop:751 length:555 start_codon:yes stop_codon:yes gene_type:complete
MPTYEGANASYTIRTAGGWQSYANVASAGAAMDADSVAGGHPVINSFKYDVDFGTLAGIDMCAAATAEAIAALDVLVGKMTANSAAPPICRGDLVDEDVCHCSLPIRAERSPDVFANGIGISRQGDDNCIHLKPCPFACCNHTAPITTGSTTVFINGKGCGRIGDGVTDCTAVAEGSPDCFAGG